MIRALSLFRKRPKPFTLQWHLTNRCGFHCAHCYDRSDREEIPGSRLFFVVREFLKFCSDRHMRPRITLTGGDPMLHPDFFGLYAGIRRRRIPVSILGNPISRESIDRLMAIAKPSSYQVSLEGLAAHNDLIRGRGHHARVMRFLRDARGAGMVTHVMLTLTSENMAQVLPLARELEGLAHRFSFNRIARVGDASQLSLPGKAEYATFLEAYLAAAREMPILGLKENLLNILRSREHRLLLGGCTGHGCGAAKDFVALLPDGEVHACRKFPSLIGRISTTPLAAIYDSKDARKYRTGSAACVDCTIRAACGGCLAVTHGEGLDPLRARDPFCFLPNG